MIFIFDKKTPIIFETIQDIPFSHISIIRILDAFLEHNQLLKQFIIWKYSTFQNKTQFNNLQNTMNH